MNRHSRRGGVFKQRLSRLALKVASRSPNIPSKQKKARTIQWLSSVELRRLTIDRDMPESYLGP
jgi:hypothetical protein